MVNEAAAPEASRDPEETGAPRSRRRRDVVASILLGVVVSALVFELKARRDLTAASDAVDQLMATHHHHALSRSKVEAVIGKGPVGPLIRTGVEREATYAWRGLRPHLLKVHYAEAADGSSTVLRIEAP